MSKTPDNFATWDPLMHVLGGMEEKRPGEYIERLERIGGDQMAASEVLPTDGLDTLPAEWGIVRGQKADDLFTEVTLPAGWRKVRTEHSMLSAAERLTTVLLAAGLGSNLGIHRDADDLLTADADLAQDIEDGAALRRLRAALPQDWEAVPRIAREDIAVEVWSPSGGGSYFEPPQPDIYKSGPTIAAAADACRVALEAGR